MLERRSRAGGVAPMALLIFLLALGGIEASLSLERGYLVLGYVYNNESFHHFYTTKNGLTFDVEMDAIWLKKGWKVVIDYDVKPRIGSVYFHLTQLAAPLGKGAGFWKRIERSESGRFEHEIKESGLYAFSHGGSVLGGPRGAEPPYDVEYSFWWGVAF